jgi:NAD(P)-dependent dehydrogenase (short-subunit alcohol dehydrogenase family)
LSGVLLVTGASRGIGAAVARLAARDGWDVGINYVANEARAKEVVAAVEVAGRRAVALRADVSVEAEVVRLFEECEARLGPLRGLVNNAGVITAYGRVDALSARRCSAISRLIQSPISSARARRSGDYRLVTADRVA